MRPSHPLNRRRCRAASTRSTAWRSGSAPTTSSASPNDHRRSPSTCDLPPGSDVGALTLTCLEKQQENGAGSRRCSTAGRRQPTGLPAAPVQLLEELSYAYEVSSASGQRRRSGSSRSSSSRRQARRGEGRLEVRRATGTLDIRVRFADGESVNCEVEVRSRKLDYLTEYRAMLLRIARESAELVQSAFAPARCRRSVPQTMHDPATIYQRFAFVQALLGLPRHSERAAARSTPTSYRIRRAAPHDRSCPSRRERALRSRGR